MDIALNLAISIGGLFIILFIGFLFVKLKVLREEDSKAVAKIILYMAVPASILKSFQVDYSPEKLLDFAIAVAAAMFCQILFMAIGWLLKKTKFMNDIERMSVAYPNVANLIIPLVSATLGDEWVLFTAAYCGIQTIFAWTHQRTVISGEKPVLTKILFHVSTIAIVLGLIFFIFGIKLPPFLANVCGMISATLGPLSMFMIGMSVAAVKFGEVLRHKKMYWVMFLRLIVCPLLVMLVFRFSGAVFLTENASTVLLIVLLGAAAPIAAMTAQFARLYDNQPGYAGTLNLISTLLCIVTIPLMVALYQLLLTI